MITVYGVRGEAAGARLKGGIGSASDPAGKPGFGGEFDRFVPGQERDGLDRLSLDVALHDPTHLGWVGCRRAGLPASRTPHGVVRLDGVEAGLRRSAVNGADRWALSRLP